MFKTRRVEAVAEPVPVLEEPVQAETADQLRDRAAELRAAAGKARSEQETVLAEAQAAADRLLAEGRQTAGQLWQQAARADREAEQAEERAGYLAHAEELTDAIPAAEQAALRLAGEGDRLREQVDALDARLAELDAERQETGARLGAASDAGDIDEAAKARTRLAALDDVTAALQRQHDSLTDRLQAIGGPDGPGELAGALRVYQRLQTELRRLKNTLDPERPEAVADRLTEELQAALAANVQRIAEEQAAAGPQRRTVAHTH